MRTVLHNIVIAIKPQKELNDALHKVAVQHRLKPVENLHMTLILAQVSDVSCDDVQDQLTKYIETLPTLEKFIRNPPTLSFYRFARFGSKIAAEFDNDVQVTQLRNEIIAQINLLFSHCSRQADQKTELFVHHDALEAIVHQDFVPHISFAQADEHKVPEHQAMPDLVVQELFVYRGKSTVKFV